MKEDMMRQAIGGIDDKLIEDSDKQQNTGRIRVFAAKWGTVAAAFALVVVATAVAVSALNGIGVNNEKSSMPDDKSESVLNSIGEMSSMIVNENNWSVGRLEKIINTCGNVPLGELPCYSFGDLSRFAGSRGVVVNLNSVGTTFSWLINSARISVDNIQKIDDDHIAAIFNVSEDNLDSSYALVIFSRKIIQSKDKTQNTESWEKTGEMYFLKEIHDIDSYIDIQPGSSVEDLYMIDSTIRYDVLRQEQCFERLESYSQETDDSITDNSRMIYKLLKNGIMTVKYDLTEMVVIEKNYYLYGELSSSFVSVTNSNLCSYFEPSELQK